MERETVWRLGGLTSTPGVTVYTYPRTDKADFVAVSGSHRIGFALTLSDLSALIDTLTSAYTQAVSDNLPTYPHSWHNPSRQP